MLLLDVDHAGCRRRGDGVVLRRLTLNQLTVSTHPLLHVARAWWSIGDTGCRHPHFTKVTVRDVDHEGREKGGKG